VLGQVRQGPTAFDLTPEGVIQLSQAGLPPLLIEFMRDPSRIPEDLPTAPPPEEEEKAPPPEPVKSAKAAPPPKAPPASKKATPTKAASDAKGSKSDQEAKGQLSKEEIERRLKEILAPSGTVATAETPAAAAPPPAPSVAAPPAPVVSTREVTIPNGQPLSVVVSSDIRQDAVAGSPLRFTVKEDMRVDGTVVIARGAVATGSIAQAAKKRLIGGSKATLKFATVQGVDGKQYRIRALSRPNGNEESERSVETNVKPKADALAAAAGTEYIAYMDGDQKVAVKQ
jgi:outer membrane biosynthesis protein TonB